MIYRIIDDNLEEWVIEHDETGRFHLYTALSEQELGEANNEDNGYWCDSFDEVLDELVKGGYIPNKEYLSETFVYNKFVQ